MPVSPNPTPPIFAAFDLPAAERLETIRALLDEGADPNATDPRLNRHESVLGRACRPCYPARPNEPVAVDLRLVDELLARGANPLRAEVWTEDEGEMVPLFNYTIVRAWDNTQPNLSVDRSEVGHQATALMRTVIKACLARDHRDEKDNNALTNILMELRHYSHKHYLEPVRIALEIGFDPSQPIGKGTTPVHYLVGRYAADNTLAGNAWAWDFVDAFIEAGTDMAKKDQEDRSGWEVVDACAEHSANAAGFARIQANRQARALSAGTPSLAPSRPARRV